MVLWVIGYQNCRLTRLGASGHTYITLLTQNNEDDEVDPGATVSGEQAHHARFVCASAMQEKRLA
jgi:hypothetical protein